VFSVGSAGLGVFFCFKIFNGVISLSRVSTVTRDIDIAILSVRPSACLLSVRNVPV